MNTNYTRVIPRDLFNESKLLKCMGRLILLMHDNQTPAPMGYDERYNEPFEVALLDEGSLTITNLKVSIHKHIFLFKTIYNSKASYPLYVEHEYCDYLVFDEEGNFDSEFIEFCTAIKQELDGRVTDKVNEPAAKYGKLDKTIYEVSLYYNDEPGKLIEGYLIGIKEEYTEAEMDADTSIFYYLQTKEGAKEELDGLSLGTNDADFNLLKIDGEDTGLWDWWNSSYSPDALEHQAKYNASNFIKEARGYQNDLSQLELNPAIAVVGYDLGEENKLLGGEGRMLHYDILIAIAIMFETSHKGAKWGEDDDLPGDWEETLHKYTVTMIKLYNIPVSITTAGAGAQPIEEPKTEYHRVSVDLVHGIQRMLNMVPNKANVGLNGENSYKLASMLEKELKEELKEERVTFFLFGKDAVSEMEENGVKGILERYEDNDLSYDIFRFIEGDNPINLIGAYDGYMDYACISKEEYTQLEEGDASVTVVEEPRAKYSGGDWESIEEGDSYSVYSSETEDCNIATVYIDPNNAGVITDDEARANMTLIISGPKMMGLLRLAAEYMEKVQSDFNMESDGTLEEINELVAEIDRGPDKVEEPATEYGVDMLRAEKEAYIKQQAQDIIDRMVKYKYTDLRVDTCGSHSSWDKKYHNHFPSIAAELRNQGFGVTSSVNHGVTDWIVTVS